MYLFIDNFCVPRYENCLQKWPILRFFSKCKTSNLRALLTRSENALLGNIFTFLCCNYDTKHAVKYQFNRPSCLSLRVTWICPSFRLNLLGRSAKTAILLFVAFLKIKISLASFSLIFENSSPKGFSWQNMKKSVISLLKINSRWLQSPGLNDWPQGKQWLLFLRDSHSSPRRSRGEYCGSRGNKTQCFSRGQSLCVLIYLPTQKL